MRLLEFIVLTEDRIAFVRQQAKKLGNVFLWHWKQNTPGVHNADYVMELFDAYPQLNDNDGRYPLNPDPVAWGNALIDAFVRFDPTEDKRYVQWIAQIYKRGNLFPEDFYKIHDYLTKFERVKRQLPVEQRDIRGFANLADLYTAIQQLEGVPTAGEIDRTLDRAMHEQAEIVFNDSEYKILIPKTEEASCYFGKNTQWCTAATSSLNYFDSYNQRGPLFIILHKPTNTRWQFQFETNSFMDANDRPINLDKFIAEHPKVDEVFGERWRKFLLATVDDYYVIETDGMLAATKHLGLKPQFDILIQHHVLKVNRHIPAATAAKIMNVESSHDYLHVVGDQTELADIGVFWDKETQDYDTFENLAQDYLKVGDLMWKSIDAGPIGHFLELHNELLGPVVFVEAHAMRYTGIEANIEGPEGAPEPEYYRAITALLANPKFGIERIAIGSSFQLDQMPFDLIKEVLEEKPQLGTPQLLYHIYGSSDVTKMAIETYLENNDVSVEVGWVGDYLIVEKFPDLDGVIASYGNDTLKYALKIAVGEENFDMWDSDVDSSTKRDLLKSLSPERLAAFSRYLSATYADDIEQEELDVTDINDILMLLDIVDDSDIDVAFSSAVATGAEAGAMDDATQQMHAVLNKNPFLFHVEEGNLVNGNIQYDTEVVIAVPFDRALGACTEEETAAISNDNWLSYLDAELKLDEPRYGFSGYDDAAATERFSELIYDIVRG